MTRKHAKATPHQVLSGWKEIASRVGMGVRTVQRYEGQLGLPVRRPSGHSHGAVIAIKREIDAWVQASPRRQEFPFAKTTTDSHVLAFMVEDSIAEIRQLREQMAP